MKIGIRIDFDSIAECLKLAGVPVEQRKTFHDQAYFNVLNRLLSLSDKYNLKYSFFLIGSDLENDSNCKQIKKALELGHEIGNHTYSHHQNLSERSYEEVFNEINLGHSIIQDKLGVTSKGFIAPAWSYSSKIVKALNKLDYEYDTSLAPSFIMPIANLKLKLQSGKSASENIPWIRSDLKGALFGKRTPFHPTESNPWRGDDSVQKLKMLPLPTTSLRFPLWHTLNFRIDDKKWGNMIEKAISELDAFYYVIHPADLICPDEDLKGLPKEIKRVERILVPLEIKMKKLENAFKILSQYESVTMQELAKSVL